MTASFETASFEITTALRAKMDPQEDLLWSGQPKTGLYLQAKDAFLVPFSLFWCGFVVFWEVGALGMTRNGDAGAEGVFFPLFGLPFVLVGLYLVAGRFFVDAYRRERTFYGVSNERILILRTAFGTSVTSLPLDSLPALTLVEHGDGTGTLFFGAEAPTAAIGRRGPLTGAPTATCFERIADARVVQDLLRDRARKKAMTS